MASDFRINGETLVKLKFGDHMSGQFAGVRGTLGELGLAQEDVRIRPRFIHKDINTADFGPEAPAEVMWALGDVTIDLTLIYYDRDVLDAAVKQATGAGDNFSDGTLGAAGRLLGAGKPLQASGNLFIGLNLLSPVMNVPWQFPASYLTGAPLEIPLGTKATAVELSFRAIPYCQAPFLSGFALMSGKDFSSSGVPLWTNRLDL